jgi:hypothetical protein
MTIHLGKKLGTGIWERDDAGIVVESRRTQIRDKEKPYLKPQAMTKITKKKFCKFFFQTR